MEADPKYAKPNTTAIKTALQRALHLQVDPPPHDFEDKIGIVLAAPEDGWQQRPDMHPEFTSRLRASMVARKRFIEDTLMDQIALGVEQYIMPGAGLDNLA